MKKVIILGIIFIGFVFLGYQNNHNNYKEKSYEDLLFKKDIVHAIDIYISSTDLYDLETNPMDKKNYKVNIVIDGESFKYVSFKTKGNSSLSRIAKKESNRYSFKINFEKYIAGQNYHGLKKLNLQNIYSDSSYMMDYISYQMFHYMNVPSPLASYVWLRINGEDFGLYLAVEEIDSSFLERENEGKGDLYKVETSALSNFYLNKKIEYTEEGASLRYIDDRISSYPDIFENAVTNSTEEDQKRVIASLEALEKRENLDDYLDTEQIIRYFVVHNFIMNYDSYIGTMLHN
mgnify:CR=1 FL=1